MLALLTIFIVINKRSPLQVDFHDGCEQLNRLLNLKAKKIRNLPKIQQSCFDYPRQGSCTALIRILWNSYASWFWMIN